MLKVLLLAIFLAGLCECVRYKGIAKTKYRRDASKKENLPLSVEGISIERTNPQSFEIKRQWQSDLLFEKSKDDPDTQLFLRTSYQTFQLVRFDFNFDGKHDSLTLGFYEEKKQRVLQIFAEVFDKPENNKKLERDAQTHAFHVQLMEKSTLDDLLGKAYPPEKLDVLTATLNIEWIKIYLQENARPLKKPDYYGEYCIGRPITMDADEIKKLTELTQRLRKPVY